MTDEIGYRKHAFICGHERTANSPRGCCAEKGSLDLLKKLKGKTKEMGISDIRVQKSGCLNYCENGPTCVVYPDGIWLKITDDSIESIANYLQNGEIPSEFLLDIKA